MPTLPQKLEAIRQACLKANPERVWKQEDVDCNGKYFDHAIPVVLSDVLAAIHRAKLFSICLPFAAPESLLMEWVTHGETKLYAEWNLLHPSLDDQEEATINLVYEILK